MRVQDNFAMLVASHLSQSLNLPLRVVYALPHPSTLSQPWTLRYITFLFEGLECIEKELKELNVPLDMVIPRNTSAAHALFEATPTASAVVCDFTPLKPYVQTKEEAAKLLDSKSIPLYQVDAHNIVPVWFASDKREVGARTLRSKIDKNLAKFLVHFPELNSDSLSLKQRCATVPKSQINRNEIEEYMRIDASVRPVADIRGGPENAMKQFQKFLQSGLKDYATDRNDPNLPNICSNMSPYVNFGHVSFQRLALSVRALKKYPNGTAAFLEEGIVRRELSDNYVFYTKHDYDSLQGAAGWARESLEMHQSDQREWIFSREEMEEAMTHDDLWNAAQLQLVREGGMHGFMRMYWAKKILEWSTSPSVALSTAQYFNDKYALDGNDPNGYVGVGWSIMGIHDMGWKERPIFGKIRYMNYAGCKRKFKIETFVARYPPAKANSIMTLKAGKKNGAVLAAGKKRKNREE